jgi:hypothetical protein
MSDSLRIDAVKGQAILVPFNAILAEAAEHCEKHFQAYRDGPSIKKFADQHIDNAAAQNRRCRTIGNYKLSLNLSDLTARPYNTLHVTRRPNQP